MTATESTRARRYLLGDASEEECAVLEQEYLADDEAIDRMAAAEDELIEDYLASQLSPTERERFERSYLASPHHRVRVETIRRLMALGATAQATAKATTQATVAAATPKTIPFPAATAKPRRVMQPTQWLAMAAALFLVAAIGLAVYSIWERQQDRPEQTAQQQQQQPPQPSTPAPAPAQPKPESTPPAAPRVFALTLSPVSVRGASDSRPAIVPAGTDLVSIQLRADAPTRGTWTPTRASIRTVAGVEVWQGPVIPEMDGPASHLGRMDVPVGRIPADDYLIALYGKNSAGAEREQAQYFLRLRKE
jgi:hypothetical protein